MRTRLAWQLLAFAALVVNLWLGGDYVEAWFGHIARAAFEIALIVAYVLIVIGTRVLPRSRP
ncbi:MAG: hypothetical protein EXR63_04935 [Dehalococcoidia bacterium]|nr:hypothetical protein [Dehalococcoidia bacterium]